MAALRLAARRRREAFLGIFGPLSLLGLFAAWVLGMVLGFAMLHQGLNLPLHGVEGTPKLFTYAYMSGTTFFTLGYGDVTPAGHIGRMLAVLESGLGFGFLAVMVSYLPVLYQAFSRREVTISLMDARAGSPPSAGQLLVRLAHAGKMDELDASLEVWERWAAELLESHLSFPVLSYYRSQHDNQSWLAALAMILDICALLLADVKRKDSYQAQLTFAMARHAAVDLALVLKAPPRASDRHRAAAGEQEQMRRALIDAGIELRSDADAQLSELRGMYEPFLSALAERLLFVLPPLMPGGVVADNWQRSAWMQRTPGIGSLPGAVVDKDHFE